ncbi:TPA: hypothetical protein ACGBIO_000472 [Providencia rettgeri]
MSKPTGKLIRLTAGDVGAYTKTEADTKIADAKKAGTDANTNANGRVPTSRKVNGKPLTADISLTAGDVSAYTKTEADTKIADAKKAGTDANTNANGRVPTSRKINGKPLTADISLTAGDVSAYTKTETDTKVADAKKAGTDANTNANGRVPTSRKINGKPLTADISLTAGDVSAYTKSEVDSKIGAGGGLGQGQSWQDLKNQRAINTVYTNSTGKPIMLSINFDGSSQHRRYELFVNNLKVYNYFHAATTTLPVVSTVIPNGATYKLVVTGGTPITSWFELR